MDDLDVNDQLVTVVVEDKDTDTAVTLLESSRQTGEETRLVNDGQASLDITRLGHGGDLAILDVEHAVLLEDRAEHGLDDNAGGRVGDEGRLLVQLLGEQVNTEVAVLPSGSRGGDADDLAGAALEHQDITQADVVAGDGDGVGDGTAASARSRGGGRGVRLAMNLNAVGVRVENTVSHLVQAVTEGVIVSYARPR